MYIENLLLNKPDEGKKDCLPVSPTSTGRTVLQRRVQGLWMWTKTPFKQIYVTSEKMMYVTWSQVLSTRRPVQNLQWLLWSFEILRYSDINTPGSVSISVSETRGPFDKTSTGWSEYDEDPTSRTEEPELWSGLVHRLYPHLHPK